MILDKIRRGVLEVTNGGGARYYELSLPARLQLLWTFRNFTVLPEGVLSEGERRIVSRICVDADEQQKAKAKAAAMRERDLVIGTVELDPTLYKKPAGAISYPLRKQA